MSVSRYELKRVPKYHAFPWRLTVIYFSQPAVSYFGTKELAEKYLTFLCDFGRVPIPWGTVDSDAEVVESAEEVEFGPSIDIAWLKTVAHVGPRRQMTYPFALKSA